MYRLTKWQRFWKLDVPSSMIGLVWNMMMSMGGGWFFLTASEAVTVFVRGKGLTAEPARHRQLHGRRRRRTARTRKVGHRDRDRW